ncbi:MAG: hypothetical protein AAB515_00105 [Patescibacteria group bacterium]
MNVEKIGVNDPRTITIHTRNSEYTCSQPNVAKQRRFFKDGKFLFEGFIYGVALMADTAERVLAGMKIKFTEMKPLGDGRQSIGCTDIFVGHAAVFHFTNLNTFELDSYVTSDVIKIEID